MKLNNFSLKNLINNRKALITISILIAFVFWLVISTNQNPIRQQTFTDIPVTISFEKTVAQENGMDIVGDLQEKRFSVTVSGPNYVVSSLRTEDFSLIASAAEITKPGVYELEVFGNKNNTTKGSYDFVSITPSTVKVRVDYIDTKKFTVEPSLVGVGAVNGLIADTPVVTATESNLVSITGPRTTMDKIAKVIAYADVNETLETSKTYDAQIKLLDKKGKEISIKNLTISEETVKVTVPIAKKATVKVKAAFDNLPSGYTEKDISYSINHREVTVIGNADLIDKMKSVELSAIDFTSVAPDSHKFDVSPVLPDGVRILDNIEYFTVDIDVSNYGVRTFKSITGVKYAGLKNGLSIGKSAPIINVKICAPKMILNKIMAKDLYALIDLEGKTAGEHTVVAKIVSNNFDGVWQIGNYNASVTID